MEVVLNTSSFCSAATYMLGASSRARQTLVLQRWKGSAGGEVRNIPEVKFHLYNARLSLSSFMHIFTSFLPIFVYEISCSHQTEHETERRL